MSLSEGDAAPAFALPASLDAMRGRLFVLCFHPRADTPGCTKEACASQEALPEFGALGFPLASDSSGVVDAYGAWVEKSM